MSPTSCLGSTTMKVNRGEGGGAGPANPKGQVKGAKKGLAGRKPGLKVKVREKVGGVVGAGGRKGGVANSRAEGGGSSQKRSSLPCNLVDLPVRREWTEKTL